jgi:predicted DNA-binding protein with PD1-like motif
MTVNEHVEILSGQGNVSLKDGKPFVHLHLVLGRSDGSCLGGHAAAGCKIFACEAAILALDGPALVREPDEATGLALWPLA